LLVLDPSKHRLTANSRKKLLLSAVCDRLRLFAQAFTRRRTSLAESDFDPILSLANEHVDEQRTPRREAHTFIVDLEAPVVFK